MPPTSPRRLRIAVLGPARFGIAEPYAGGLEAHTAMLARALIDLGHSVTVWAGPADAPRPRGLVTEPIIDRPLDHSGCERLDNTMPPGRWEAEDAGYRTALSRICDPGRFDVVHNNSLHYLPPTLDGEIGLAMVHTLHTPPFDTLELAHRHRLRAAAGADTALSGAVVAVSEFLAGTWGPVVTEVIGNGVRIEDWPEGDGAAGHCMWLGRIVPEKAPHLAIDAARLAGRPIVLAGPIHHPAYWRDEVAPRLGCDARWVGHVDSATAAELCRDAAVGVVTPQWDEPFGLVIAEMLASGTPVAAFGRGAIPELIDPSVGVVARSGDVADLALAIDRAAVLDRRSCRAHAVAHLSARTMAQRYVDVYRAAIAKR